MILVIGASGFIGKHIIAFCRENNIECLGTYYSKPVEGMEYFDITKGCFKDFFEKYDIKIEELRIIFCSAIASIDACKRDLNNSTLINVTSVKRLLDEADSFGIRTIFFSSEAVFDGKSGPYAEDDVPNPVTIYGKQKLELEKYIQDKIKDYAILRVSRGVSTKKGEPDIFGEFFDSITMGKDINCLKNQTFSLTDVDDIARIAVKVSKSDLKGIFHISSNDNITRYDLARMYADKVFGGYEKIYERDYKELPFIDDRHIKAGLVDNKIKKTFNESYRDIEKIISLYMSSVKNEVKKGCKYL